jgi:hypothetical protein
MMAREIEIVSGGKKVPLNSFAQKAVLGTLLGLLGALRDVDTRAEIRITVTPEGPDRRTAADA